MYNRFSDLALTPTRVGSNIPRMVAGLGEESRALREIARYRAGKIDAGELINNTGAWFQDAAPKARLLAIATDSSIPVEKAAEQFGFAFNDATQFAMSRGTQGAAFRTGAGKLLGQYGTWPANYAQFVRKLAARSLENPKNGVPALATFTALNFAALKSAQAFSIDASNWLFFSPIGYSGSPTLSLLQAAAAAPEETQAGHDARAELIKRGKNDNSGAVDVLDARADDYLQRKLAEERRLREEVEASYTRDNDEGVWGRWLGECPAPARIQNTQRAGSGLGRMAENGKRVEVI